MVVTMDLKAIGLGLIFQGLLILIIFCIVLIKNLITTIKHANKILEDAEQISTIAAERTVQVNGAVGDLADSLGGMAQAMKGNESLVASLGSIAKAITSIKNLIDKK